jgi:hypothetical protein
MSKSARIVSNIDEYLKRRSLHASMSDTARSFRLFCRLRSAR